MMSVLEIGEGVVFATLACGCALLLFLLIVALRISGRLGRIERLLAQQSHGPEPVVGSSSERREAAQAREFERFLAEDPARRQMAKKEQFAAYRDWRKQQKLSWGT